MALVFSNRPMKYYFLLYILCNTSEREKETWKLLCALYNEVQLVLIYNLIDNINQIKFKKSLPILQNSFVFLTSLSTSPFFIVIDVEGEPESK